MTAITRRYRFAASHRLHSPLLGDEENERLYGKCNNPYGHGHDYTLEITVTGDLNPATGLIVPLARLDKFAGDKILRLFAHRNINQDVPQFANLVPTTENVVKVIGELISEHWPIYFADLQAHVSRVQVQETDRNGFELLLASPETKKVSAERIESVIVHA